MKTGPNFQPYSVFFPSLSKEILWKAGAVFQCTIYRPSAVGAWRYPVPYDASPQTIDWERFLGNAPKRPFDADRFFHFRNWWDYGTGIAGDEYVHLLTRVHYCLNVRFRLSAYAQGGIYKWKGDREVPDIHNTLYRLWEIPGAGERQPGFELGRRRVRALHGRPGHDRVTEAGGEVVSVRALGKLRVSPR